VVKQVGWEEERERVGMTAVTAKGVREEAKEENQVA
jgi:hypothetical protein